MHLTDKKDIMNVRELIGEGVFDRKPRICERGTSWQNVATTLNAIDGFLLTARTFRNRVTNLIKKFSDQNKSEGEEGIGIYLLNMIFTARFS